MTHTKKIVLLFLLLTTNSWANSLQAIKVLDGAVATCKSKVDSYENRYGVYRIQGQKLTIVDENFIDISLDLDFLACGFVNGSYQFIKASPFKVFFQKNYSSTSVSKLVKVSPQQVLLKAFQDGKYQVLYSKNFKKEANNPSANIQALLSLSEILSESEYQDYLAGKNVKFAVDFYIQKFLHFTDVDTNSVIFKDLKSFGSYRVFITLSNRKAEITR